LQHQLVPLCPLLGCLPINRQCIQAYFVHHKRGREEWERESNPTKLWGICERVNEVFSPISREISVVLLLVERGCNSHIT
jgi:hypothetical protein